MWSSYIEQDIESYTGYQTMLRALGNYLENHPEVNWKELIEAFGERYDLKMSIVHESEVATDGFEDHDSLKHEDTHIFYNGNNVTIHHKIEGSSYLIEMGPAKMPTRPRIEALVRVIILAILGIFIYFWLWPMSKDLDQLRKSTQAFGKGDFDAKAPDAKSSMIEPLVMSYNMMAGRIKRLIDSHKELTNAVAHELRTPLARSKFALQMLPMAKDDEKREKYIKQITSDVAELDELINEMLLYASFDNDTPELKVIEQDISELVTEQSKKYDQSENRICVKNHVEHLLVDCDYYFMERAIHNYISNAIKYGNGHVLISTSVEDGMCIVKVEDNGDGVSDELKQTVFDAFSRGDNSRNKETGGFGLGLAIVGRIMEWHKGQALVEDSEILGGAAFILKWPQKLS